MTPELAETAAVQVGVISVAIGAALLAAPRRVGPLAGLGPRAALAVGAADAVVGAGILAGRPRSAWMVGRAATNVGIAAHSSRQARAGVPGATALTRFLLGVTVADTVVAATLARAGR